MLIAWDLMASPKNRAGCPRDRFPGLSVMRKTALILLLLLGLVACLMPSRGFRAFWERWLVVSVPMEKADTLIVLGGESRARPLEAARLFKKGVAPRIFITGDGDAVANRRILTGEGVPAARITVEPKATTTYENALLLKPLLEDDRIRSALIVTSPFHTRRALATFRKVIPSVSFGVTGASIASWKSPTGDREANRFAALEFVKTLEYWVMYGIDPTMGAARPATTGN